MSTPYTAADWIPRDDLAVLAHCSTDTIRRDERKHELETRTDESGRVLVNVGKFLEIGRLRESYLTAGSTPAESAAMARSRQHESELRQQITRLEGKLDRTDLAVDILREQLSAKDKQLAKRDEQISTLTGLIGRLSAFGGAA